MRDPYDEGGFNRKPRRERRLRAWRLNFIDRRKIWQEERQRTAAVHDASRFLKRFGISARFWSAAVLCRFLWLPVHVSVWRLIQSQQTVLPWWGERWHLPAFILFVFCWIVAVLMPPQVEVEDALTTKLLVASVLLTSVATLGRQLPLQNVLIVVAVLSLAAAGWAEFTEKALEFRGANWQTMIFWVVVFLNARGLAQFLLRSLRSSRFYGWQLIAGTGLIFTLAVAILSYWLLYKAGGVLPASFLGTLGISILLLPLMINKRPVEPPVSWQPIVVLPLLLLWAYLPRI